MPVAILGAAALDVLQVDESTIRFGTGGSDAGIACGDVTAMLTGETFGGTSIIGSDTLQTVGCGDDDDDSDSDSDSDSD